MHLPSFLIRFDLAMQRWLACWQNHLRKKWADGAWRGRTAVLIGGRERAIAQTSHAFRIWMLRLRAVLSAAVRRSDNEPLSASRRRCDAYQRVAIQVDTEKPAVSNHTERSARP